MRSKKVSSSSAGTHLEPISRVQTPTRRPSMQHGKGLPNATAITAAALTFTMKLRATSAAELRKAVQRSGTQASLPPLTAPSSSKKLSLSVRRDSGAFKGGGRLTRSPASRPITPDTQSSTPLAHEEVLDDVEAAEQSMPGWAAAQAFLSRASGGSGISKQEKQRIRQVFERFKDQNAHEIHRSDLYYAAMHLGYVGVSKEASLNLASQLSEYPTLDLDEFVVFLEQYTTEEQACVDNTFAKYASKITHKVPLRLVPEIVHDLGLTSLQAAISETLDTAQLSSYKALSIHHLRALLAAHLASEGFTKEDRERAREAFDAIREGKQDLPLHGVGPALALFQGADALDKWNELWRRLGSHVSSSAEEGELAKVDESRPGPSVDFHEFLVWARRLEVQELAPVREGFSRVDTNEDGLVSEGEFLDVISPELCLVFSGKLSQVLADGNVSPGQPLSFDDVVRVLRIMRSSGNQTTQETRELQEVFQLFDTDDSGKMDVTEMVDVLMYLGFSSTLETTQEMMRRTDIDGNDELDLQEFLACMRQNEIMQSRALRSAFDQSSDGGTCNHLELATVLLSLQLFPGQAKLNEMLKDQGIDDLEEFDFRQVCEIAKLCRQAVAKVNRQRACFPEKHVQTLERLFKEYAPSGTMDRGGLICCLSILELPMNTMQERDSVLSQLDAARYAAQAFGVEEVSFSDSHMLTFYKLLHLLRLVCVGLRRAVMERELAALNAAGIAQAEVVEFREVFHRLAMEKACSSDAGGASVQKVSSSRRRSMPAPTAWEALDSVTASSSFRHDANLAIADLKAFLCVGGKGPQIFVQDVMDLLLDLGVPLTSKQQMELRYKATLFAAHHNDAVDFATFIQLIRWMLDVNLGDINRKTSAGGSRGFQAASAALSVSLRSRFTSSRRASAS